MSDTPSLFDHAPKPGARTNDPDTSHQAAAAVTNVARRPVYEAILAVLDDNPGTDEAISYRVAERFPEIMSATSPSGLRTRRKELMTLGLVQDSGTFELSARNRKAAVWQRVGHGSDS